MKLRLHHRLTPFMTTLLLLAAACNSGAGSGTPGSGGSGAGTGGSAAGTGGSSAGTGGSAAGTGGSAAGTGGSAAGTGGSATDAGGQGGAAGGGTDAGPAVVGGDDYVTGVNVAVHPQTSTILIVTWTQARAAEMVWLEFTFTGGSVMTSRAAAGTAGAHRDVVLGVPSMTAVTVRIIVKQAGVNYKTRDYMGTTGALPANMPRPTIVSYDATIASPDRWLFGSVEDSMGGCTTRSCYFSGGLFYVYIMDRQGRIVWYYVDGTSNAATGFQRIARDGEYIWIERSRTGTRGVTKMTLDRVYMESIMVAGMSDAIDVTSDGALLYDVGGELRELARGSTQPRTIWRCQTFGMLDNCYTNTVNWSPADDTVLMSFVETNTVVQIDRQSGTVVATYGDRTGSYAFSPNTWSLEYQHFPNITPQGTLLVSSHLPMFPDGTAAGANHHAFTEFDIDRTNMRLVERWSYTGAYWPLSRGMAMRMSNGNTLVNYGTNGIIQEITPTKQIAFQVKFDVPTGNDFANKMVGNNVLINDLYALNGGGPR